MNEDRAMDAGVFNALTEHASSSPLERGNQGEAKSRPRPIVRITRRSTQLLDPVNLWGSAKSIEDRLCDSKLIPNDDTASIDLYVSQTQVAHRKEAGTYIEIEYE